MKTLISIIVPVYNAENTLNRCVDSILNQTFTDFELLLIDDGSIDQSGKISDEYAAKDQRIKVFHKENGGVSSARNIGLDNAKGEWITFCDSDDFVFPNWLKHFVDNISDEIDLVCQAFECNKPLVHEFKNKRIFGLTYKGHVQDGVLLLDKNHILGYLWTKLFRRSIIVSKKIFFDTRYNYWEDQEFCFRYFSCVNNIVCIEKVGYYYFLPDWETKYTKKNHMFYMYQSLYNSAMIIYSGKINHLIIYFLDSWIGVLLSLYKDQDCHLFSKRKYLIKFRKQVGSNIMKSHMSFLIKLAIYLDKTTYISNMIIKLYIYCRL